MLTSCILSHALAGWFACCPTVLPVTETTVRGVVGWSAFPWQEDLWSYFYTQHCHALFYIFFEALLLTIWKSQIKALWYISFKIAWPIGTGCLRPIMISTFESWKNMRLIYWPILCFVLGFLKKIKTLPNKIFD